MLLQNGLNIEKPFLQAYSQIVVLSGVSLIGSAEPSPGRIVQNEPDRLLVGAFPHPTISDERASTRARDFVEMYSTGGKTDCKFSPNVMHDRWRKLVYNACLNPICAITGVDSGRLRLADGGLDGLVRPAMKEIVAAAKAIANVVLEDDVVEKVIATDPLESWAKPSMQQDLEKVISLYFVYATSAEVITGQLYRIRKSPWRATPRGQESRCTNANTRGALSARSGHAMAHERS